MYSDILGATSTGNRVNQSAQKKGRKEPKLDNDLQLPNRLANTQSNQ